MADRPTKGLPMKWRVLLLLLLPLVIVAGNALMNLYDSEMVVYASEGVRSSELVGTRMLLDSNLFDTLYQTSHQEDMVYTDSAALHGLWFIFWASATSVLVLSSSTWLPLASDTLFPKNTYKFKYASMLAKVPSIILIVLSFAAAVLFLLVAWNILPLLADVGRNPNLVYKGTDTRVMGVGPLFACLGVIIMTLLLLLPAIWAARAMINSYNAEASETLRNLPKIS
jgi:hypothetical protein